MRVSGGYTVSWSFGPLLSSCGSSVQISVLRGVGLKAPSLLDGWRGLSPPRGCLQFLAHEPLTTGRPDKANKKNWFSGSFKGPTLRSGPLRTISPVTEGPLGTPASLVPHNVT